ncbi:MAG: phosphatidate cytidylyltransferase [Chloroflexota bacterium]|nr:MAG: phosphatidate cytidylyltransferase [Chloroflexota bacterium]
MQNFIALIVTFAVALVWLRLNDYAAHRGWISSHLSRKIIHMGTGPFFVLCWLLFDDSPGARFLAALVPFAITVQFILVGTGVIRDEAAVRAMSRSGDRREILRGPLYYGIVFVALTLIYWRDTPIGIIALMLLCGGDGLADLLGRRFGTIRLPWNPGKTWAGSTGMYLGGWIFAFAILAVYVAAGAFAGPLTAYFPAITYIAVAGTLIESLPLKDLDNITVALTAVVVGHLLL